MLGKAAQTEGHQFAFNPVSAICMAEIAKLFLSLLFLAVETGALRSSFTKIYSEISIGFLVSVAALAFMYCFNNQMHFFLLTFIDPGTVFLSRAGATLMVASLQYLLLSRVFDSFQWQMMSTQLCGVVMVQFDPSSVTFEYSSFVYCSLAFSLVVTALCTVQNEYLLKEYDVGINVQNFVLYFFGVIFNVLAYQIPLSWSTSHYFFEGYDHFTAIATVVANAFLGLAITCVYKYADAVTKTMATDATSVILVAISILFFDFSNRWLVWVGTGVTLCAIHCNQEYVRDSKGS